MKEYLLFDLDGTLTDPGEGITKCVQYALESFGIVEEDLQKLECFIGPPLKQSFMEYYNMSSEDAELAIEKYRERFRDTGIFENRLYDGIPELLRELRSKGKRLAIASSKPLVFVERILEHFKISQYFDVVVGSELDGTRVEKEDVIREALRLLFEDRTVEYDKVFMIGDRLFDIEGAKAIPVESVGVTYGYGGMDELKNAKADYIVRTVEELQRFLLRDVQVVQKPPTFFQTMWPLLYPFLLFVLIRRIAQYAFMLLLNTVSPMITGKIGDMFLIRNAAGEAEAITGNAAMILNSLSFVVATLFIWKLAKPLIIKAKENSVLMHLKGETPKSYMMIIGATIGCVISINILLELMGVTNKSVAYQTLLEDQYSATLFVGLICAGIIIPITEEILFRGIIFNHMRKSFSLKLAMLVSAFCYGAYHMDAIQGVYAFIIGCLIVYAYEYFGSFGMPILIHILSSSIVYLISYTFIVQTGFYNWITFLIFGILGIGCISGLTKEKKIF